MLRLLVVFSLLCFAAPKVTAAPPVAENGDRRGQDNDGDRYRESTYVRGHYRKDGTYVQGHYRLNRQDAVRTNLFNNPSLFGNSRAKTRRR